ncbi:hypothetical protein [Geobacter sp. AOG1]|uniref:hypothetical protein n=1 Tax=Geobacter sp. AOG1 TaxID=1566346 RepID=UPI001CC385C0|nr:hypothetical protein [Geobacter sp. AOG1]GFE59084.1 hypothetical protein AOG1_29640 [Geobacter sp. AOG1]
MKFLKMALLMVCVVSLSCLVGCSKADTRLVGKWKNQSLPEIVEFKSDKTGIFLVKDSPSLPFTWTVVKGSEVRIDIPFQGQVRSLTGSVEKNVFTLNGQGEQAVYVRME